MIVKITPPDAMVEMMKARGETIRSAEALASHAAQMLKQSQRELWSMIQEEYPEIDGSIIASCDHKTGIITVSGGAQVAALIDRLSKISEGETVAVTKIKVE